MKACIVLGCLFFTVASANASILCGTLNKNEGFGYYIQDRFDNKVEVLIPFSSTAKSMKTLHGFALDQSLNSIAHVCISGDILRGSRAGTSDSIILYARSSY